MSILCGTAADRDEPVSAGMIDTGRVLTIECRFRAKEDGAEQGSCFQLPHALSETDRIRLWINFLDFTSFYGSRSGNHCIIYGDS